MNVRRRCGVETARLSLHVGRRRISQGAERNALYSNCMFVIINSRRRVVVGQATQGGRATTLLERAATAGAEKRDLGSARAV